MQYGWVILGDTGYERFLYAGVMKWCGLPFYLVFLFLISRRSKADCYPRIYLIIYIPT